MRSILLDTHTLIWLAFGHPRLSTAARSLLEDPNSRTHVSRASLWELAIKFGLGKIKFGGSYTDFVDNFITQADIEVLEISS